MTLHVCGNLKEAAHKRTGPQVVEYPLLVAEESLHKSFWMGIFVAPGATHKLSVGTGLLYQSVPRLIEVILQRLADVIMETGSGICSSKLLALCYHREYTAVDNGRTGIDSHILCLEDLWEILGHTFSDAMMLTLSNG